jgi:hypothetical protein
VRCARRGIEADPITGKEKVIGRQMLEELTSLLDLPFQIVDRSIATCGSSEFGQTGLEEAAVAPIDLALASRSALKSVVCGGWSTILNYSDGSQTILGLNHERGPVRRFQVNDLKSNPVSQVAVGDTFSLLLRPDNTINVIGDLSFDGQKATNVFGKFGMATVITPEKNFCDLRREPSIGHDRAARRRYAPHCRATRTGRSVGVE